MKLGVLEGLLFVTGDDGLTICDLEKPITTKITNEELSISEKVIRIRDILKKRKRINFKELFDNVTKKEVIVNFLSILDVGEEDNKIDRAFV